MNPTIILTILKGTELIAVIGPLAFSVAESIKKLLSKDPALKVTLQALQDGTIRTAEETLVMKAAWEAQHPKPTT